MRYAAHICHMSLSNVQTSLFKSLHLIWRWYVTIAFVSAAKTFTEDGSNLLLAKLPIALDEGSSIYGVCSLMLGSIRCAAVFWSGAFRRMYNPIMAYHVREGWDWSGCDEIAGRVWNGWVYAWYHIVKSLAILPTLSLAPSSHARDTSLRQTPSFSCPLCVDQDCRLQHKTPPKILVQIPLRK